MIGQMAIAIALLGFKDLGRSMTPTFLFRNRFYLQLSPHCPKMNKKSMWEVKKIRDFCPRDMESCHLAVAKRVKLWLLNANFSLRNLASWLNSLNRPIQIIFGREHLALNFTGRDSIAVLLF